MFFWILVLIIVFVALMIWSIFYSIIEWLMKYSLIPLILSVFIMGASANGISMGKFIDNQNTTVFHQR